jgi:hypothetical protein
MDLGGVSQHAGTEFELQNEIRGTLTEDGIDHKVQGSLELILLARREVLLHVTTLTIDPPSTLLNQDAISRLLGAWWKLPSKDEGKTTESISPDPSLLRMQADVIKVTKDHGLEKINDHDTYHYDVTIDPEKLLTFMRSEAEERHQVFNEDQASQFLQTFQATGEVWIDSESFFIRRLEWNVTSSEEKKESSLHANLHLDLTDHNTAPEISPPTDVKTFSPALLQSDSRSILPLLDEEFLSSPSSTRSASESGTLSP